MSRKEYMRKYRKEHRQEIRNYRLNYYKLHKQEIDKNRKKYYKTHRQEACNYSRKYRKNHKKEQQKNDKLRWEKNRIKRIKQHIIRTKIRYHNDIYFRLICNLRTRINQAIKNNFKKGHTLELLDCSVEKLRQHLEKKFKKGMNWDNYGKWHIDHIRPCASFDLSKESEQKKCFNYKNLQPLWAKENLKKNKGMK